MNELLANNSSPTRYDYFLVHVDSQNVECQSTIKTAEAKLKEFEATIVVRHEGNDNLRLKGMLYLSIISVEVFVQFFFKFSLLLIDK